MTLLEGTGKMTAWLGQKGRRGFMTITIAALFLLNLNGALAAGSASISGCVWFDDNVNKVQDSVEPGLSGVTVNLTWAGPDGTFGTGDDVTYSWDTDANGDYLFENLDAGDYTVEVDTTTLPYDMAATYDLDGTLDSATDVTLAADESRTDVDFGYEGVAETGSDGQPTAITLSSFMASSASRGASFHWPGLAVLATLAAGGALWIRQR